MPEHGDKSTIGIARIDDDGADLLSITQAEMLPRMAAVRGLVNPVSR